MLPAGLHPSPLSLFLTLFCWKSFKVEPENPHTRTGAFDYSGSQASLENTSMAGFGSKLVGLFVVDWSVGLLVGKFLLFETV